MTFQNKKEQIFRFFRLGIEIYRAEILAGCTEEEIELLDKDAHFQQRLKEYEILEEYELLEKHQDGMDIALERGNTSAAQWKLERINPNKWGLQKQKVDVEFGKLIIKYEAVDPKDKEDDRKVS